MLHDINLASDAVIWLGATWLVLTSKIATRTFSCVALTFIGLASLINMAQPNPMPAPPDTILKACFAALVAYCFYRVEVRHLIRNRIGV